jgi:diguanylate cyclase (GGDEF)-like protein
MSLSKQLLLLISVLFVLIFGGNFAVSVNKMRDYLQVESRVHAQDTATSLGLSLSPHLANPRAPILATMIQAIYDMGYYKEIRLTDLDDQTLVALNDSRVFEQVPRWFIAWLPLETATATSEISSGWNLAGVIHVSINPGYAYLKLYQQMRGAFYYSLAALLASVLLLSLVLRFTLQPLKKIDRLARTIASGRFERIEPLPWTSEVRNVAMSMNVMSGKLAGVIDTLNQRLDTLSQRLTRDELTGLYKRSSLETDLKHGLIVAREANAEGYVVVLRINHLVDLIKHQGHETTDEFLKRFAEILSRRATASHPQARAYRVYGSEFALLMSGMRASEVEPFVHSLSQDLARLGEDYRHPDIVHLGIAPFNPLGHAMGILTAATDACEQAGLIGANSYFIRQDREEGRGLEEWRELVFEILDQSRYQVSFIGPVENFATGEILMEEAFTEVFDADGKRIPSGMFVAMAEKYARIIELDKGVTRAALDHLRTGSATGAIAVNLSMTTLKSAEFRFWLMDFLRQHRALAGRLAFSVTAYGATKDVALFQDFIDFVHRQGARILLKRYEARLIPVETLKSLKPDYIRLARDLTLGISDEPDKRALVEAMRDVGDLLDILILAENVQHETDFTLVRDIGLAGASH